MGSWPIMGRLSLARRNPRLLGQTRSNIHARRFGWEDRTAGILGMSRCQLSRGVPHGSWTLPQAGLRRCRGAGLGRACPWATSSAPRGLGEATPGRPVHRAPQARALAGVRGWGGVTGTFTGEARGRTQNISTCGPRQTGRTWECLSWIRGSGEVRDDSLQAFTKLGPGSLRAVQRFQKPPPRPTPVAPGSSTRSVT